MGLSAKQEKPTTVAQTVATKQLTSILQIRGILDNVSHQARDDGAQCHNDDGPVRVVSSRGRQVLVAVERRIASGNQRTNRQEDKTKTNKQTKNQHRTAKKGPRHDATQ